MSQLFLKSNLLHLRTNEGEFVVSNPEVLTCLHIRHMPDGDWRIKTPGSGWTGEDVKWPVEWPGGVELNWRIAISTARDTKYTSCTEEYAKSNPGFHSYAVARLLPKEEFKPAQPTPNFPKGGTTFTESAYKEFEGKDLHIVTPESSEEEQEELWKEARHYIDVWRIEELFKRFTIRRNGDKD